MSRAFRSSLLLLSFFSLQLSLLGGGAGRSVIGIFAQLNGPADMARMDMAGMNMAGRMTAEQPRDGRAPHGDASDLHHNVGAQHHEQSCDSEGTSPRTTCNSMTVCVFAAVTSPSSVGTAGPLLPTRVPKLAVRAPATEGDAPDLPPPRA